MKARHCPSTPPATADLFASEGMQALPATSRAAQPATSPRRATGQLWYAVVFAQSPAAQGPLSWQRLCLSAQRFTSLVSIETPNALLLEIKGSLKLFGSLAALQAVLDAAWVEMSPRPQNATAPTALAALWLARAGKPVCIEEVGQLAGALADLPLACTAWDAGWLQTLRAMGVTRLGDVMRLPRAGVARRLGPTAILDLDIALGRQPAPRRAFVPYRRFRERCDFETDIETVAYLLHSLEPLVQRCAGFLRERQAGIQELELWLRHRAAPPTHVRLGLASITSARRRLTDVLEAKLNRLELAAPVMSMELRSGVLQPLPGVSLDAFAGLRNDQRSDAAPPLVERLRARLGDAAVYGVCCVAEHRPEAAAQRVRAPCSAPAGNGRMAPLLRPIWLLRDPVLLAPHERMAHARLIFEEGPERIESGWWDGKDVARDYYVARAERGAKWWVFQERRTRRWYLHGVFA